MTNGSNGVTSWRETDSSILSQLDIEQEYKSAGLRTSGGVSSSGWLQCHSIGREDRTPSAGIFIGDGSTRGRYVDHASGESLSMWDAIAKLNGSTWREARAELAKQTSVVVPSGESRRPEEAFHFGIMTPGMALRYSRQKAGIVPGSLDLCGGRRAEFPAFVQLEKRQTLIAFPSWSPDLFSGGPIGYHCVGSFGQNISIFKGKGKEPVTSKTMQKGPIGLINNWAVHNWELAEVVWIVEGITDLLCLQGLLGERTDHVAVCFGGAGKSQSIEPFKPVFAGKDVRVLYDSDPPTSNFPTGAGHAGAVKLITVLVDSVREIRNVVLPYKSVREKKDLRDWVIESEITEYQPILELSERFSPIDAAAAQAEKVKLSRDGVIANAVKVPLEGGAIEIEPLTFSETFSRMAVVTGDWPRRVGDSLFIDTGNEEDRIRSIKNSDALFGYFFETGKVDWQARGDTISKREFTDSLRNNATAYDSLEEYPHFPSLLPNVYYATRQYEPGDGSALEEFLEFFSPSSESDRFLLESMVLTLFWSGPMGARPCFLLTTKQESGESGVGSGKSVTAEYISDLVGGATLFSRGESSDKIRTRLLSGGEHSRVLLIDNVRSDKFRWADFESLVTTKTISGHQLYHGNAKRPNYFTWVLTLNSPSLGTDIAKRCIPIELARPVYEPDWKTRITGFLEDRQHDIASDVMRKFQQPVEEFDNRIRWGDWSQQVLGRLPSPQDLHDLIIDRQGRLDTEAEEAEDLAGMVKENLLELGYDLNLTAVFVSNKMLSDWYKIAFGEHITPQKVSRLVSVGIPNSIRKRRKFGRGHVFTYGCLEPVSYDIDTRLRNPFS